MSAVVRYAVRFTVDDSKPPPRKPLHDALTALRGLELEAPTEEVAEHYAALIVAALEREADRGASKRGSARRDAARR